MTRRLHWSSCTVNNAPALPVGPCDCGGYDPDTHVELEEFEPGRWRVRKPRHEKQRSKNMPLPFVISDIMDPVEQVDGRFYTSKSQFRAVGKANGLIEVGNEKPKLRTTRPSQTREAREARRASLKKAVERVRAGNFNSK